MDWVGVTAAVFTTGVVCITAGYIAGVTRAYKEGYDEAVRRSTPLLLLAGEVLQAMDEQDATRRSALMMAGLVHHVGNDLVLTELGQLAVTMRREFDARVR
jgi:hypothetical protein